MPAIWTRLAPGIAALALALASGAANADDCDFLTGGGFIIIQRADGDAKANFGVGGACKDGGDQHGLWGHLEYIDHGTGTSIQTQLPLNVHWTSITGYSKDVSDTSDRTRFICGTARTNQIYGDVNFVVRARDGEPGVMDEFDIELRTGGTLVQGGVLVYTTDLLLLPPHHQLSGGNIQLHNPNRSTTGTFSDPASCPGVVGG